MVDLAARTLLCCPSEVCRVVVVSSKEADGLFRKLTDDPMGYWVDDLMDGRLRLDGRENGGSPPVRTSKPNSQVFFHAVVCSCFCRQSTRHVGRRRKNRSTPLPKIIISRYTLHFWSIRRSAITAALVIHSHLPSPPPIAASYCNNHPIEKSN